MHCLELGPLEGGHSYMLQQAGASRVVAVEANRDAYFKCLIVKELLELDRCSFLYGDALEFLEVTDDHFDACWCSGILYHMVEPIRLIHLVSERASRLYMWTHYYDSVSLAPDRPAGAPFARDESEDAVYHGFKHTLHRHDYGTGPRLGHFWGGTRPHANWLTLEDILGALEYFGWRDVQTQITTDHPYGPCVNLVAVRR